MSRREREGEELERLLDQWLAGLSKEDRVLFLRRYWNCEPLNRLGQEYKLSHGKMAKRMYKLRHALKEALAKEGYLI